jgi:hypothetical protein
MHAHSYAEWKLIGRKEKNKKKKERKKQSYPMGRVMKGK